MTLDELITTLKAQGLSDDTIKGMASCYELGYGQALSEQAPKENAFGEIDFSWMNIRKPE